MECGLRTDYGLQPDEALDRIARFRMVSGPQEICIKPGWGSEVTKDMFRPLESGVQAALRS
eukprot:12862911-Alexandrium_andersonii.AAC.1